MTRAVHPWSTCAVRTCGRRTRVFPSGTIWICGRCYRKGPKHLRDRRAQLGRKKAHVRIPQKRARIEDLQGQIIGRIIRLLNAAPSEKAMSLAMREQLRQVGLL